MIFLPYKWVCYRFLKAFLASSLLTNSTKPNPLWLLELTFLGNLTFLSAPYVLNNSLISLSVDSKAKFLTSSLLDVNSSYASTTANSDFSFLLPRFLSSFAFLSALVTSLLDILSLSACSSKMKFCSFLIAFSAFSLFSSSTNP